MKTKLTLLIVVLFGTAAAQSFKSGQVDINLGYGLANTFIAKAYTVSMPGTSVTLDLGISSALSLGIYGGLAKAKYELHGIANCNSGQGNGNFAYEYTYTQEATHVIIGVRGAYHFTASGSNEKLDAYGGLMLGNDFESDKYSTITTPFCDKDEGIHSPYENYDGFAWSVFAGVRYRFSDHFGVFGELGYGITVVNVGLNIKL